MPTIHRNNLRSIFRPGAQIVTIFACTVPDKMRKTNNPYRDNCFKWSVVNGMVNWVYENAVNRQRVRENQPLDSRGNVRRFTAASRLWGVREYRGPFVHYNGKTYLELKVQKSLSHQYVTSTGQLIPEEKINPFLRGPRCESKRQEVDKPVICRDYRLDHILAITINETTYNITG